MPAVAVTKQSAAHRLLIAAVRMFERGDDELATFVVASAAYATLRELVKGRGDTFQASILRTALFADAKRTTLGLPRLLPSHPFLDQTVSQIADLIRTGEIAHEDDLKGILSIENERELIRHQIEPYNFLKHADRDPTGILDEGKVNALSVIASTLAAYSDLFPGEMLPTEVGEFLRKHGIIDPDLATP